MKNRVNHNHLKKTTLTDEFYEAEAYNEETKHLLNAGEQFFAEELQARGMKVKFNDLHILAKGESNTIFSQLRSNLPET